MEKAKDDTVKADFVLSVKISGAVLLTKSRLKKAIKTLCVTVSLATAVVAPCSP